MMFDELEQLQRERGSAAAIDRLIGSLREQKEYRRLFDAMLLKKRFALGLPLAQPTSLDVPDEQRDEFERAFIEAAREIGGLYLAEGDIPQAWGFLNMIREPQKVAEAIESYDASADGENTEDILQVALYEGANPVKGLEIMLRSHGTCNTITALDQTLPRLAPAEQQRAAALLVKQLYEELSDSVRRDIEQRQGSASPEASLRQLIARDDSLLANGNYHIDVSHLHSVVRFARQLQPGQPALDAARQLAEYGARLDAQFQYPGDAPFDDYYPAHGQFFSVLVDDGREDGLRYFRERLAAEPDEEDKPYLAVVLVDLLARIDRLDDAIAVAEAHLAHLDESSGFSFAQLCQQAGRLDALGRVARQKGDLVAYTAALVDDGHGS